LAKASDLVEFVAVIVVAYIVANAIRDSLTVIGLPIAQIVGIEWLAFFVLILIYYGLIRGRLNINR